MNCPPIRLVGLRPSLGETASQGEGPKLGPTTWTVRHVHGDCRAGLYAAVPAPHVPLRQQARASLASEYNVGFRQHDTHVLPIRTTMGTPRPATVVAARRLPSRVVCTGSTNTTAALTECDELLTRRPRLPIMLEGPPECRSGPPPPSTVPEAVPTTCTSPCVGRPRPARHAK